MYSEFIARKDAYLNRLFSDNFFFELLIFHDGVCNVWVCVCVGVLVICVLVFTVFCTIFTVPFVFRLCFFCTSVRTTATE